MDCKAITITLGLLFGLFSSQAAFSEDLKAPTGKPILVLSGHIKNHNKGDTAVFDLQMLEEIDGREAVIRTPWTPANSKFSGPFLRKVLEAVGAQGKSLRFSALNGYEVVIPFNDATDLDVILATRMNEKALSVREHGPVFLVYPFDQKEMLYNEKYFARSIWQIASVVVED